MNVLEDANIFKNKPKTISWNKTYKLIAYDIGKTSFNLLENYLINR